MPSSLHFHVTKMIDWIVKVEPRSVLDIGVGFGKWGFLAREYCDIFSNRYERADWQVRIDGIEAFPAYATPTYDYIYNNVYYGDATELLPQLPEYDLIIIGDVIEHFPKDVGLALLAELRKKCGYILLSSPTVFFQQEILDNPFETHKSLWTVGDFDGFKFDYDEFDHWIFVALLQGSQETPHHLALNGLPARLVYSNPWIKRRPLLARLLKGFLQRRLRAG